MPRETCVTIVEVLTMLSGTALVCGSRSNPSSECSNEGDHRESLNKAHGWPDKRRSQRTQAQLFAFTQMDVQAFDDIMEGIISVFDNLLDVFSIRVQCTSLYLNNLQQSTSSTSDWY